MKTTIELKFKDSHVLGVTINSRHLSEVELLPVVQDVLDSMLQRENLTGCSVEVTMNATER